MLSWYNVHIILVNIELIIVIHCFSLTVAKWEEDFLYFVKLPLVFVCSYTSSLRVWVKATDPPAGADTCCDTDPASTQTIVLNSSSSKSDIALAFSSHGFHTTKMKVSYIVYWASCFATYSFIKIYQTCLVSLLNDFYSNK